MSVSLISFAKQDNVNHPLNYGFLFNIYCHILIGTEKNTVCQGLGDMEMEIAVQEYRLSAVQDK